MATLRIGAVVMLAVVVGFATSAWQIRRTEARRLIDTALTIDAAIDGWRADRAIIVDGLPSEHYRTTVDTRRAAAQLQHATEASLTALDRAVARLRRLDTTGPWTAPVDTARDQYVRYAQNWSGYLQQVNEHPVAGLDAPPPTTGRADAAQAVASALPPFAGEDLRQQVTRLLTY